MRDTAIIGYRGNGFVLTAGHLDLGTEADPGRNVFTGDPSTGATALSIQGVGSRATSSATSFDGEVPTAQDVPGPDVHVPWYDIANSAQLTFF